MNSADLGAAVFARLPLGIGLFLLPGWLLGRRLGTPCAAVTTVLGSAAVLPNAVFVLDALRLPLTVPSIGLVLLLFATPLIRRAGQAPAPVPVGPARASWLPTGDAWLWVVPVLLGLGSIATRAVVDPLSGFDNITRWDHLARLMLAQNSLAHYPPVSSADFELYPWCDGIPPLASILNFWIYLIAGSAAPGLVAVRVVGEAIVAGIAVFRLGRLFWGTSGGWAALAAGSTSSLLLWACAMGQETGLTTATFAGLALLLEIHRRTPSASTARWAGLAAGVAALAREYGLALIPFGLLVLALTRSSRADLLRFSASAVLVAAPWYLRNWVITGNPVFPHSLGGLLPTNPVHVSVMQAIAAHWGVGAGHFRPSSLPVLLGILAGPVLALAVAGVVRAGRQGLSLLAGMAVIGLLWWISIPFTAAGWTYAMRVLAPAIAATAALAGWIATTRPAVRRWLAAALILVALDGARRTWMLPSYPDEAPWPYSWNTWREEREQMRALRKLPLWTALVSSAPDRKVLVDHPAHHVEIILRGGCAVPWFSPAARALFAEDLQFAEVRERLRSEGVRFVTVTSGLPSSDWLQRRYPALRELTTRHVPVLRIKFLHVYDLDALVPVASPPSAP